MANDAKPADAAATKKKGGLIRWKVLIVLVLAIVGFGLFGVGPVAKWAVEKYGSAAAGSKITVDKASGNLFTGTVTLEGVREADPADPTKNAFEAKSMTAKVEVLTCLKGQVVVDDLGIDSPKGRLVRGPDGSINGANGQTKPDGMSEAEWKKKLEEQAKSRDLVQDFKNLMQKLKEKHDAQVAQQGKAGQPGQPGQAGQPGEKGTTAEWAKDQKPKLVIKHLHATGVEIALDDQASGPGGTQTGITDGTLDAYEVSSAPSHHDQPIKLSLTGKVKDAPGSDVKLDGTVDVTGDETKSSVNTHLAQVPLATIDALFKNAIPVAFQGKTLGSLDMPLDFQGFNIDWKPSLVLDQIDAKARDSSQKIAGFPSTQVAQELTNAGKLALSNIHVHGPVWAPQVDGDVDAIKQLVTEGGKAYAMKQAQQQAQKLMQNPQAQKVEKALQNTGVEKTLESAPGGVGDAVKGLFGGGQPASGGAQQPQQAPDKAAPDKHKTTGTGAPPATAPASSQAPSSASGAQKTADGAAKQAGDAASDAEKKAEGAFGSMFGGKK